MVAGKLIEALKERNERVKVESDWVLRRLVELAEADIAHLVNANGDLRALADMPDGVRRLVAGIDVTAQEGGAYIRKVRLVDRLKVLELIGKHVTVSAFRESVNHGMNDDLLEAMERARRRSGRARSPHQSREES